MDILLKIANGFLTQQKYKLFVWMVGALDGVLVKIHSPSVWEFPKPVQFWTCKGYYALNVQAVCDASSIWQFVSVDCPGSAHDSTTLWNSALFPALEFVTELLPDDNCISADAAYKAIPQCLVPFEGSGQNEAEQNFSYFLASLLITVECAFGLLMLHWGILWLPLLCTLQHNTLVVLACFALHNFC